MTERRIEKTTSRTAEMTCLSRAASALEKSEYYHSDDSLALRLLPYLFKLLFNIPFFPRLFMRLMAPVGAYEYIIARTKFIDALFKRALQEGFDQIILLGAGFDTRALRFQQITSRTRIFELDAPTTQQAKIGQYRKRNLAVPDNLTFIPADFEKEDLTEMLEKAGVRDSVRSLIILEGLLMYLQPETVHETFTTIRQFAGKESEVVFDYVYASVLRGDGIYEGEEGFRKSVAGQNEAWTFGIEKGGLDAFLSQNGLKLIEHKEAPQLIENYFTDSEGKPVARVTGTHALVLAGIS